jgi:UTP--glucose-1-phosphate uridylyltransferase
VNGPVRSRSTGSARRSRRGAFGGTATGRDLAGVLTLAGEGSRMLPWSRGLRKEFLPLFDAGRERGAVLKPMAHLAVETLMGAGVTDLTFVVQPRDRATVANYFTVDRDLLRRVGRHPERLAETRELYDRLRSLKIHFALQPSPAGFGDAVLRAASFVGDRPFLLHASDAFLDEPQRGRIPRAMAEVLDVQSVDAVLLVRKVRDPRRYGVVEGVPSGRHRTWRQLTVTGIEEKPSRPRSSWAATAIYAFRPSVFAALRVARRKRRGAPEFELTWGIQELLDSGRSVAALVAAPPAHWRSVGSPDSYFRALRATRLEQW